MKFVMKNLFHHRRWAGVLNIIGLSASIVALYIISVQVWHDFTFNKGFKDSDKIYMMTMPSPFEDGKLCNGLPRPLCETVISSVPSVRLGGTAAIRSLQATIKMTDGSEIRENNVCYSLFSAGALDVFGVEMLSGNKADFITHGDAIITESASKRLGLTVGDSFSGNLHVSGENDYSIVAICKDFPKNSDFEGLDLIANVGEMDRDNVTCWAYTYFVILNSDRDIEGFKETSEAAIRKYYKLQGYDYLEDEDFEDTDCSIDLYKYTDLYYSNKFGDGSDGERGSLIATCSLIAVAIMIVLITFINYVNFFFALVPIRIRSVNVRKILGSSRAVLVCRFVVESLLVAFVSLTIAWCVLKLLQSTAMLSAIGFSMDIVRNWDVALFIVALFLFLSIVSSLYPAFYITSFSPAFALKGFLGGRESKGYILRTVLLCIQFIISISLVIIVVFVYLQYNYMINSDLGFRKDNLYASYAPVEAAKKEALVQKLKSYPEIVDLTWAMGPIVSSNRMEWGREINGKQVNFACYPVDYNFLDFMGISIKNGRDFVKSDELSPSGAIIFNEKASNMIDIKSGEKFSAHSNQPTEVVGICSNFSFRPLQLESDGFAFLVFGQTKWFELMELYIRAANGISSDRVNEIMHEAVAFVSDGKSNRSLKVEPFDIQFGKLYYKEKNISRIILLSAIIAIIVSAAGVFGLVLFDSIYRRKEIGIRRVYGATIGSILLSLNIRYIKMLIICFVFAVPVSWLVIDAYLSRFTVRVPVFWLVFVLIFFLFTLFISIVVTLAGVHSASTNPVVTLKSE